MILYLLNLADLASTLIALSHGLVEMNPIINAMLSIHPILFPAVKIILAFPLSMWLARNARRDKRAMARYIAVVGIYAVMVIWNIAAVWAVQ